MSLVDPHGLAGGGVGDPASDGTTRTPAPSSAGAAHAPLTWGTFVLLDEVGKGGFGTVYRAFDPDLKRDVALKVIDTSAMPEGGRATVLHEGRLLAKVRHANVATVFSVQTQGAEVGLVMEFIRGGTLAQHVLQQGVLAADEAARIGAYVCDAVAAVHRVGLVHRDIKASNVMRESGGRIVLVDFGAGREFTTDASTPSRIVGTPLYMPPEVIGGEAASPASDIYSIGVLLFYLVTGEYPVAGDTLEDLWRAHQADRRSLADVRPGLSGRFVAAVDRALSLAPDARHATASQLRRELDAVRAGKLLKHPRTPPAVGPPAPAIPRTPIAVVPFVPTPVSGDATIVASPWVLWLQRMAVLVPAFVLLCGALGFLTTLQYNLVLGRTGEFASEPAVDYLVWGFRSVIPTAIEIAVLLLIVNGVGYVSSVVERLVPAAGRLRRRASAALEPIKTATGVHDATMGARALTLGGVISLALVIGRFRQLLEGLMANVDVSPTETLAVLAKSNDGEHIAYRLSLTLLLLVMTVFAHLTRRGASAWAASGMTGVMLVALVLLVAPWRVLFSRDYERLPYSDQDCYVVGHTSDEYLLNCPQRRPPRNQTVPRSTPRGAGARTRGDLLSASGR